MNVSHSAVDGSFGAGATVQFTVTTSGGTPKGGGQGTARPDGWMNGVPCNCNIQPGDHVRVTSNLGFDAVLVPITIGGQIDAQNDLVSGQMSGGMFPGAGSVWAWSNSRQQGFGQGITIDGDGKYSASFKDSFDIMAGDQIDVWYNDANGNQVGIALETAQAQVNVTYDTVSGSFGAGATVQFTVTTSGGTPKGGGQGATGPDGRLNGGRCNCDIQPGDHVHVTSNLGFDAVLVPITIGGKIDAKNDLVSGQMSAGIFPGSGFVSVYSDSRQKGSGQSITIDGDGKYSAPFTGRFDIMAGDKADVWYNDANGNQVGAELFTLRFDVNYGHDWVQTQGSPGTQVTVTLVGKGGVTGLVDANGWYNTPGLQDWTPPVNDIAPGDAISVTDGSSWTEVKPIGTITGRAIRGQDLVFGNVYAPWFAGPLAVRCEVWVNNGGPQPVQTMVQPAGGSYQCDFKTVGWHIVSGQDIAVRYVQPDGNSVINVFHAYENDLFLPLVLRSH